MNINACTHTCACLGEKKNIYVSREKNICTLRSNSEIQYLDNVIVVTNPLMNIIMILIVLATLIEFLHCTYQC